MPRAYAYVRYSSTVQSLGDSVDRQTSPLKAFTHETGVEVIETIIDEGVSSFRGDNASKGKFKEVLSRIDRGIIRHGDYLVVESIDRITRQRVLDGVELLQSILKKGVRIYTTSDSRCYSYDDPDRDFETLIMISLIAKRANEESEIKSKRRKSAWNKAKLAAVERGVKFNAHNPPYGLTYDRDKEQFVIVDDEAAEIRLIFELLKVMGVSNAIRKVNVTSKRKWNNRNVSLMIENKYPLGMLMSQKRNENKEKVFVEYIENYYPKIVSDTLFNEAVMSMRARKDKQYYGNTTVGSTNIFRHVIKCAECGETMLFEKQKNQKGVVYPYFNCFTRKELKGQCDQRFRFDLAFGMLLQTMQLMRSDASLPGIRTIAMNKAEKDQFALLQHESVQGAVKYFPTIVKIQSEPNVFQERQQELNVFGKDFNLFLSEDQSSNDILHAELSSATELLAKLKRKLENFEKSIDGYDGVIPISIMKSMERVEMSIQAQVVVVDNLSVKLGAGSVDIKISTFHDLIERFRTEQGRLEINDFFKSSGIRFKFRYDKAAKGLHMWVSRNDKEILSLSRKFKLHNPLSEFGIPKLSELYET